MGASANRFLVLNLDNSLSWQRNLLAAPHIWADLTHLEGKKSCATPETLAAIQQVLEAHRDVPVCFWGPGEYHYVTLARLKALRRIVTLILFDHHPDCAPVQGGIVTCGDWARHALQLPWVRKVVWVGGREPEMWGFRPYPRLMRVVGWEPPEDFSTWLARSVPTTAVYISVDKDVLAPGDVQTTWGAGDMPLSALLHWLRLLGRFREIVGADVGGEWALAPGQLVPALTDWPAIRRNEQANLAIWFALADQVQRGWPAGQRRAE